MGFSVQIYGLISKEKKGGLTLLPYFVVTSWLIFISLIVRPSRAVLEVLENLAGRVVDTADDETALDYARM